MGTYLLAIGIVLLLLVGWVAVQQVARLFAARHPEFGPYQEKSGGCGGCGCGGASCSTSAGDDG
jgi:hypothetical protein